MVFIFILNLTVGRLHFVAYFCKLLNLRVCCDSQNTKFYTIKFGLNLIIALFTIIQYLTHLVIEKDGKSRSHGKNHPCMAFRKQN